MGDHEDIFPDLEDRVENDEAAEDAAEAAPDTAGTPESDVTPGEEPTVEVALSPDFTVPVASDDGERTREHPSEVRVSVPGVEADDIVLTDAPVGVPASVAFALDPNPAVVLVGAEE